MLAYSMPNENHFLNPPFLLNGSTPCAEDYPNLFELGIIIYQNHGMLRREIKEWEEWIVKSTFYMSTGMSLICKEPGFLRQGAWLKGMLPDGSARRPLFLLSLRRRHTV